MEHEEKKKFFDFEMWNAWHFNCFTIWSRNQNFFFKHKKKNFFLLYFTWTDWNISMSSAENEKVEWKFSDPRKVRFENFRMFSFTFVCRYVCSHCDIKTAKIRIFLNALLLKQCVSYLKYWKNQVVIYMVARFFLVQNTKTGENVPNYHELYQMSIQYNKRP
jgi:hypothetical protein